MKIRRHPKANQQGAVDDDPSHPFGYRVPNSAIELFLGGGSRVYWRLANSGRSRGARAAPAALEHPRTDEPCEAPAAATRPAPTTASTPLAVTH